MSPMRAASAASISPAVSKSFMAWTWPICWTSLMSWPFYGAIAWPS